MEKRNYLDCIPLVNMVTSTLSLTSSIKKASLLKHVTYDVMLSSSRCLMFNRLAKDLLYLYPPIKWVMKCLLNSLKVETILGPSLLNHTLVGPLSVVGNALHMISFGTPCRCMSVLNDSRWSSKSHNPSYVSTCGIWNLARKGKEVTCAVKGESVHWTNLSKLVDTYPFMAFIIMFIFSFIIYMSWVMRIALVSNSDKRLVSSDLSHLLGTSLSS